MLVDGLGIRRRPRRAYCHSQQLWPKLDANPGAARLVRSQHHQGTAAGPLTNQLISKSAVFSLFELGTKKFLSRPASLLLARILTLLYF